MDYLAVLREAVTITWKFKFLWFFGFFVALTSGSGGGGWNFYNFPSDTPSYQFRQGLNQVLDFIYTHLGIIIILGIIIVLFWFLLIFLSLISQAAIIGLVGKIENKKEINLREGFRLGVHYFWRVLGLFILIGLPFFVLFLFIVVPFVLWIVSGNIGFLPFFIGALVLSILLFIVLAVLLSFVSRYAIRHIVLNDQGILDSLSSGFRLLFVKWKESLLVWLLLLVVGIVVGIAFLFVAILLFAPAIAFVILAFVTKKLVLLVPGVGLAIIVIPILLILRGIYEVFYSSTWTLTFLELTKSEEIAES